MKIWFITGCSKGFGRALVEALLEHTPYYVVATARNPASLNDLEARYGERMLVAKLDVTNPLDIEKAVAQSVERFHRIDVLVNNAGYGLVGAFEECSMQDIREIFETNVFGLMAVTKAVLPIMRQQQSGHIINLSSVAGLVGFAGASVYNSTKFAVEGITEAMAQEVAAFGMKVTLIEPGPFRTDFLGQSLKQSPVHPDYRDTAAYAVREYFQTNHHRQEGDPIKAAHIMIKLADMQDPPLRLPLGNNAFDRIFAKHKLQQEAFLQVESLGRSADY